VVALAISDGVALFELAAPCAVFGATPPAEVRYWYDLRVCGPGDARVDRWFLASTQFGYDDLVAADTVVVPACHDGDLHPPADLVTAVRAAYERGARVLSICTGAFVLAEAGILDGRRAATHWKAASTLAARYPAVTVDAEVLYVDDDRVLTSAGKSAGMDLCLHVVRRDHGAHAANEIARHLVTGPHRDGGQAQYIAPYPPGPLHHSLSSVQDWVLANLDQPITVEDLARHANTTTRTLNRYFHAQVGTSPQHWLHSQRIRRAQELLEHGQDSVDTIARRCGFGTPEAFRRQFRRAMHTTPSAYRQTFGTLES
jgi:transcriptional regulator GlxA family with amidase domain